MSELFVVGHQLADGAGRRPREARVSRGRARATRCSAMTATLPVAEALLISTCNRVEVYGVGEAGRGSDRPRCAQFLARAARGQAARRRRARSTTGAGRRRSATCSRSRRRSTRSSSARRRSSASSRRPTAWPARPARAARCSAARLERAFGVAKRVRTETPIARGAANVSSVAVELAARVFGNLDGKSVLVVGAGKMSTLAARHLYSEGAQQIVVTNRSPEKAEALAAEIEGIAKPWGELEALLVEADVVISSTGAREPILTRALFKKVTKARRWQPMIVIDIAVPRDAEPAIDDLDGVYLYDIDALEKVVAGEPRRAREGGRARRQDRRARGRAVRAVAAHAGRGADDPRAARALRTRRRRRGRQGARPARQEGH